MSCIRIWILRLQWWFLRRPSVILVDYSGDANARLVHGCFNRYRFAKRHGMGVRNVRLLPDGRLTGATYVESWEPLFGVAVTQDKQGT